MRDTIADILFLCALPFYGYGLGMIEKVRLKEFYRAMATSGTFATLAASVGNWGNWVVAFALFFTMLSWYMYFKSGGGKKGKKVAKELGDKSRVAIREMVNRMTPSPIPEPV